MKRNKTIAIYIPVILLLLTVIAAGSEPNIQSSPKIRVERDTTEQLGSEELNLARQLVAQGAYISAADLLEAEYAQKHRTPNVISLLLTCYMELKAYSRAEVLLKRQILRSPDQYLYYVKLLELYLKTAEDSAATATVSEIRASFPGNPDIAGSVLRLLIEYGRTEPALKLIAQARLEFERESLFNFEAASIYEMQQLYGQAVQEYFRVASGDSATIAGVEKRMAALIRFPGAAPEVIEALRKILVDAPNNVFAVKILLEAYTRNQQFAEAFDVSIHLDSLTGSNGRELFNYIRRCLERKLYRQVIDAAGYLEQKDYDKTAISQYRFFYAEALVGLGQYDQALTQYTNIADSSPNLRDKVEALLAIGDIYRYNYRSHDSARVFYNRILSESRIGNAHLKALMELAQLHLVEGNLDQAKQAFEELAESRIDAETLEYFDYTLALIDFYRHEFAEAELGFRKVMANYPRGFYVNDALMHSLVIGENALGASEALISFADAEFFEVRLMPDSAESRLKLIRQLPFSPLFGLASYRLAEHYLNRPDTAGALAVIADIEANHADDYYYPYCLKLKGDIYFATRLRHEAASEIYRTLLENYNMYPFIGEIRDKLQRLEGYRVPGQS
ncbi:MAG: hypothetical protein JSV44_09530 [Candidatus Zixiibacteriota bacterium]|nr:MAG: hypothetical protein JSV44_09530 [candidate division Zixibacteria bacterium]